MYPVAALPPSSAAEHDDTAIIIDHVDKHFGNVYALRDLSAEIHYGRLTGLVGPDGAGKTTLMRACWCRIPATPPWPDSMW